MTFEVYLDEQLLFYPNDEAYVITNGTVEQALNEAGAFECDVPSTNPLYSDLESKVRKGMIRVIQNGTELFYGEIREVTQNFNMTKHVYAVGELAFLFDSIQPQAKYQTTPYNVFKGILDKHNSQVESKKQFKLGYVTVTDSNDYIYRFTNYEDTLTALREKMCDSLDGFLRIRKVNGVRYLDLINLENYGSYCKQEIQFGENLLDYSCNTSANEIATAVIPLGKRLEDDERTSDAIEGLDQYLTIKGKETYTEGTQTKTYSYDKDYVINQTAVNKFGYVKVVKHWEDITLKRNLKAKAEEWLKSVQFSTMELQINAFDGNLLDINVDSFDVGDTIHAWALPYGMDTTFPVRKKTTYINDVSKNLITLGSTASKSYTSQASKAITLVEEQLPEESEMLRNAKNNALAMLNGSIGGHVIFKFDSQNKYVEELLICNASTEENSTQMWKWNLNGLGFMSRKTAKDKWTDLSTAITMDGKIVANFITSGTMAADRIKGGTLSLGGKDNGNGKAYIYTSDGKIVSSWDNDGITFYEYKDNKYNVIGSWYSSSGLTIKKGSININNMFQVSADGKVDIDAGTININGTCFSVDVNGKLSCTDATLTGNIKSSNHTTLASTADGYYLGADGLSLGSKFSVDKEGNLSCSNVDIDGTVDATGGSIGALKITENGLEINESSEKFALTKSEMGLSGSHNGGWGTFKAKPTDGIVWLNTANDSNGGIYVCAGGSSTTSHTDGDYIQLNQTGLKKKNGKVAHFVEADDNFKSGEPELRDPNGTKYKMIFKNGLYCGIEYI